MTRNGISLAIVLLGAACGPQRLTIPTEDVSGLADAVSAEVSQSIGADGRFIFGPPVEEDRPVMGEAQARAVARFAGRVFGPHVAGSLESQHRQPIDFSTLDACGPAYFARSPFESVPDGHIEELIHYLGPRWIVAVCAEGGRPAISVAIAANAVAFQEIDGRWNVPPSAVVMVGIPPSWPGALPVSPEGAVVLAARLTGSRITSVPALHLPNARDEFPQGARWDFALEEEVEVRGDSSRAQSRQHRLTVGSVNIPFNSMLRGPSTLLIAIPGERRDIDWLVPTRSGPNVPLRLQIRAGMSIDMERATIVSRVGQASP